MVSVRVSVAKGVSISHEMKEKSGGEVSGDEIRGKQQAGPNTANCGVGKKE